MKILVIEDDKIIRDELISVLNSYGYQTIAITNFDNILSQIQAINCDLILLDINLPINDGYYICKKVREKSNVPIIITTSRDTSMDEIMGINLGADDFIKKPYNINVLIARIERILNRISNNDNKDYIIYNDIKLNIAKAIIEYNNQEVELSKNELLILKYLITHKNEIVSRDDLILYLWDSSEFIDDNTLSVNINRIRGKLSSIGIDDLIHTRRGIGYLLQ